MYIDCRTGIFLANFGHGHFAYRNLAYLPVQSKMLAYGLLLVWTGRFAKLAGIGAKQFF